MRDIRPLFVFALAAASAIATTSPILAQERTTATYDDWVLQCAIQSAPPGQKTCDIEQLTEVKGGNAPLSRVAIARAVNGQPAKLTLQVPVNVAFRAAVRIQTADSDPGLAAPFDRCLPVGCFADFAIKDDAIRKFRTAAGVGKITFKSANGQDVVIPMSFKGFGPAFDALAKE